MSTPAADAASTPPPKVHIPSDPEAIEREIALRQARLAATVDELTARLSPKEVGRRAAAGARGRAVSAVTAEDGSLRVERIGAAAAAVLAVVVLVVRRRRRRRDPLAQYR
ncbi:DUF3618 domain-containing protein [Quadrisphaera sp. GCM10027208]|uniref:DUF3618 domain-containing protein n=1 Tax=Quadrisphaera sp. GCM10027208 TaxID=3273423 RepID=UPI003605CB62|nr:DUF3618 domain-containing protein [Kineosporiaceae bacterium SCSIO 59966]